MIVNSYEEYNMVCSRMNSEEHICTPVYRDRFTHPIANGLLCVQVTFFNGDTYTISISHRDTACMEMPVGIAKCYTFDIKAYPLPIENLADVSTIRFISKDLAMSIDTLYTNYIWDTYRVFETVRDVNKLIPLTIWAAVLTQYNSWMLLALSGSELVEASEEYRFQRSALAALRRIEQEGIAVDPAIVKECLGAKTDRYIKDGFLYSQYNLQTTTGRPSNRFGGVNFSSLNKSDGSRAALISRYPDGSLIQLDFDAYHLRLLADWVGCPLPDNESPHTALAKLYFSVDEVTPELYARGKQITFEIIYGATEETYDVELFACIASLRTAMFEEYQKTGKLILPTGSSVLVEGASPSKILNYHMQAMELVSALPKINSILDILKPESAHLILYTYDSILIDMRTTECLPQIVSVLSDNGKFPLHISRGKNYHDMEEFWM